MTSSKIGARVLLAVGFLAASVSYSSWIAHRTVLDPSATRGATHALITAPAVRRSLARELHDTLAPQLGRAASDPKLRTAINAAVADPRFVRAFDDAIANIHAAILSDRSGRVTLDTRAVTGALRTAIARHDPAVARQVRSLGTVSVPLGPTNVPHLGGAARSVGRVGAAALVLALLLIGGALLLVHDHEIIGRVGRRIAVLALGPAVVFSVAPRLLDAAHGEAATVAAAVLRAYGHRVLLSAAVLAVVGVGTWIGAHVIPAVRRRRQPSEPPIARPRAAPLPEKLYL